VEKYKSVMERDASDEEEIMKKRKKAKGDKDKRKEGCSM
jgi:hypothetical protein